MGVRERVSSLPRTGGRDMRIPVVRLALAFVGGAPASRADSRASRLDDAVQQILAQPYQAAYVPTGFDTAFADPVPNTAPAQDYTTGSIPGSPDAPAWPAWFRPVQLTSADGAPLLGQLALHPGSHPAVVVAHGFNTHGYAS